MKEWISVKDRLPDNPNGGWVLVYADGAINCMGFHSERQEFEDWLGAPYHNIHIPSITHWMPLPEPPK